MRKKKSRTNTNYIAELALILIVYAMKIMGFDQEYDVHRIRTERCQCAVAISPTWKITNPTSHCDPDLIIFLPGAFKRVFQYQNVKHSMEIPVELD
jgi:hypothetical protein